MIKEGDVLILKQLAEQLKNSFDKMRKAYGNNNAEEFNNYKREFIQIQKNILEVGN